MRSGNKLHKWLLAQYVHRCEEKSDTPTTPFNPEWTIHFITPDHATVHTASSTVVSTFSPHYWLPLYHSALHRGGSCNKTENPAIRPAILPMSAVIYCNYSLRSRIEMGKSIANNEKRQTDEAEGGRGGIEYINIRKATKKEKICAKGWKMLAWNGRQLVLWVRKNLPRYISRDDIIITCEMGPQRIKSWMCSSSQL